VHGTIDPVYDMEVVNTELILADLETIEKRIEKDQKLVKTGDRTVRKDLDACLHIKQLLGQGVAAKNIVLEHEAVEFIRELHLLTAKKVLYVANVSEAVLKDDRRYIEQVRKYAEKENSRAIVICGDLEAEITLLPREERREFLADLGLKESGLETLIREGYELLGLITFYTTVGTELRAWTIVKRTRAPVAAGKIHSDMERGFIRAEIIHYDEFIKMGNMTIAREKGLIRSEGKDYTIIDGDIVTFRFSA